MVKQETRDQLSLKQPNAQQRYEVSPDDLPLHCPLPGTSLWNSHPRVFIPVSETGTAYCPYCGALFVLAEESA